MFTVILCTCPNIDTARDIARHLVENKLAACVKIVPQVESFYIWQDALQQDTEVQLLIKSTSALFEDINTAICSKHPYDVPEVIAVDVSKGNAAYLDWVQQSVS